MPPTLLFVYGTLKAGFVNHHANGGERLPGEYITRQRYPLVLIGRRFLPWMMLAPGEGEHVIGQLFRVQDEQLARMDELERVHEPGWYRRVTLEVRSLDQEGADDAEPPSLMAQAYLGERARAQAEGIRLGPLPEYTLDHADLLLQSARTLPTLASDPRMGLPRTP